MSLSQCTIARVKSIDGDPSEMIDISIFMSWISFGTNQDELDARSSAYRLTVLLKAFIVLLSVIVAYFGMRGHQLSLQSLRLFEF
ncbi:uncharacterized protein PHALS_14863 [Plasmopara halstedii]|uniref:Uncharacterized protein n=1 Tax=Plasmopara halstedii TaxID=4781 RepID=A0A0P1A6S9_PLAHL|nr:uncharacterized protein PHALS_14863 [Plasmopara halstedii]CEG36321.1 hypothetical protein PHALS_14863 [Plasmopara halstedii]|eukprot:XP_024572690.1 hypothetical protein PHALS_14863 [Plasmopara halstedii]